ncbi:hypothetical protein Lal_00033781 [Lupinus albus]|nr:hypothetical protein Lal_00033781 [Lupinus albus]
MASNMKEKYDKYWYIEYINYLLFVIVFLGPRYKLAFVEFCFKHMYEENKANKTLEYLRGLIKRIYYQHVLCMKKCKEKVSNIKKSDLDRYLDDDFEELPCDDPFDILN